MENHIEQYQRNQVFGMSQRELILMLYDGAIRFLNEGKEAIGNARYDQSWTKLDRARKIVLHLYATLNMEAGQIATDLAALYSYVVEQICVANARRETDKIDVCINVLSTVREGWQQIPDTDKPGATAAAITELSVEEQRPVGLSIKA